MQKAQEKVADISSAGRSREDLMKICSELASRFAKRAAEHDRDSSFPVEITQIRGCRATCTEASPQEAMIAISIGEILQPGPSTSCPCG